MVNSRPFEEKDIPILEQALEDKTWHDDGKPEHFYGEGKYAEIFEDSAGPVAVVRYTKSLRLCTAWCDPHNKPRNARTIIYGIKQAVEKAKAAGFKEIIFETENPELAEFCTRVLGFKKSANEYILYC